MEGSASLMRALQGFDVEQFIYASTMLVHAPCRPGERIDESQPISPRWTYPRSKAAAEDAILRERGQVPVVMLRLAGVYDRRSMVPTLAQQFACVYEKRFDSYFYPGDTNTGQAMLHRDDMLDAFVRCIDVRSTLPPVSTFLIGEVDAIGYDALQDRLGHLMHAEQDWPTT
ncbi:NAD-dependent epimerase/dehydratase family protein, partial [Neobacillus paridis]